MAGSAEYEELRQGRAVTSRRKSKLPNLPPKKRIIWITTSAKVRMSDPDLEKNDILSTQYKLAIVTVIHVTTWEVRASISVVWPGETSEVPTSPYEAPL